MPLTYIETLTYEERAVSGTCPICGAEPGQPCDFSQGVPLGVSAEFAEAGAHTARLVNAPTQLAIVREA